MHIALMRTSLALQSAMQSENRKCVSGKRNAHKLVLGIDSGTVLHVMRDDNMSRASKTLLRSGENCWKKAQASKFGVSIDGEAASALSELCRVRWKNATGDTLDSLGLESATPGQKMSLLFSAMSKWE